MLERYANIRCVQNYYRAAFQCDAPSSHQAYKIAYNGMVREGFVEKETALSFRFAFFDLENYLNTYGYELM